MKKYENPSSFPDTVDQLIFFQDIDIPHQEVFEHFRGLLAQGNYTEATEYINSVDDVDGYFADLYNLLVKRIYNLQYHLKLANTKFIYSTDVPTQSYPFIHNGVIWFNYNKHTKAVASSSHDSLVNEQIMDNMVLRRIDSINKSGSSDVYDIEATVTSNKLCFEDIQLDDYDTLKEDFEDTVNMDPIWYTDRTYYRGEEIVEEIIVDHSPARAITTKSGFAIKTKQGDTLRTKTYEDYTYDPAKYFLITKNEPKKQIITVDDRAIVVHPYEATTSIIYIYSKTGRLLRKITLPTREPVLKADPDPLPEVNNGYIHCKFRIMANLPTLLWHRLSFVTDYSDTLVPGSDNVKDLLDRYAARVRTNIPRLLAPANSIGISRSSVSSVSDLIDSYDAKIRILTDTIKSITGEGEHLTQDSMPREIALFILNQMYSPIIDAVFRLADRKGLSYSRTYTMRNALTILEQLIVIPLYIKGSDGTLQLLKTRDGKSIRLKIGSEE